MYPLHTGACSCIGSQQSVEDAYVTAAQVFSGVVAKRVARTQKGPNDVMPVDLIEVTLVAIDNITQPRVIREILDALEPPKKK